MRKLLFIVLLLFVELSFSQHVNISKKQLLNLFKETIVQTKKGIIQVDSNPWFTENTDNLYFKNDTIVLKNARSFKREYCKIVNWNFYKKNAFIIGYADYCNEPPTQKVTKPEDWAILKFNDSKKDLVIELYNQNKIIDKFRVLYIKKSESKYDENEYEYVLILLRLKSWASH